jgi:hypothetical protein
MIAPLQKKESRDALTPRPTLPQGDTTLLAVSILCVARSNFPEPPDGRQHRGGVREPIEVPSAW